MLNFIAAAIFLMLPPAASADAPPSWRPYMSPPHVQGEDGLCPVYAAIHCMEGLYNYYYELKDPLIIANYVFNERFSPVISLSPRGVFHKIKTSGIMPVDKDRYPNLFHAYYSTASTGDVPSNPGGRFTHDNLLDNIKQNIDNWGPVCLYIWNYPVIKNIVERWEPGDFPVEHVNRPGEGVDYHWVVVVDYGEDYLECFNSYPTNDDHFFKMSTDHFDTWGLRAVWASLHISSALDYDTISSVDPNLNFYYAPKIYPYLNKYFVAYNEDGTMKRYPDIRMDFFQEDERIYIFSDNESRYWSGEN